MTWYERRLRQVPPVAAAIVVGIGALVLIGWAFDVEVLKNLLHPQRTAMNPATATSFILAGLALWAESGRLAGVQKAMARVGRVAMSCYILQSIVCTAIFYGWGLGWFGKLDRLQMLAVVAIVWAIDILFAALWLRKFRIGPLEWLWRSAAEGRWIKLRSE